MCVFSGEEVVGFILISYKIRVANIDKIAVHTNQRRKGIASSLLDEALIVINEVLRGNNTKVMLMVDASNSAAQQLYKIKGFEIKQIKHDAYGEGEHGFSMVLQL